MKITIVGLGVIGGSLAKALKNKGHSIIGIDKNISYLEKAKQEKIVEKISRNDLTITKNSDIIFVCTPLNDVAAQIKALIEHSKKDTIFTDVCSVKKDIIEEIQAIDKDFIFVGGHPMAGVENTGYNYSFAHMFENAYYILSKTSKCDDTHIDILSRLLKTIGAIPILIDYKLHDKVVAAVSHVPHIISAGLVNMVEKLDDDNEYMQKLAAGGFKDITRISSSSPEMWEGITLSNKENICEMLDAYIGIISQMKENISLGSEGVLQYYGSAKAFRDSFDTNIKGLGRYTLKIEVEDRPGIISEITKILGNNNINISNININNNREYEGGIMTISFKDKSSLEKARLILGSS